MSIQVLGMNIFEPLLCWCNFLLRRSCSLELFSCASFGQPRVVYVEKDMLNLAESYFRRAHELSGEFLYHVHNGLSSIYLQRGDAIKALRHGLKAIIIARNHLDPAVDAYEYQQGISNIGLILRNAGSFDAGKIRTLLKSYNLPMDYRVYFEEAFQVVVREINAYRKSHNPKCFLRILDSGRWHTSLNMQVMLPEVLQYVQLTHWIFLWHKA